MCAGQHYSPKPDGPPRSVTVEVGSAGHEKTTLTGEGQQLRGDDRVVIGVEDLDGVGRRLWNGGNASEQAGVAMEARVRDRRNPAGLMNDVDDVANGRALARHERGAVGTQVAIEGLGHRGDVARAHERVRDRGPADRMPAVARDEIAGI